MAVEIVKQDGGLSLSIDGKIFAPAAYMTYLDDNARYEDFKVAGCKIFSVCVNMGDSTINPLSGVRAFSDHVWKSKDEYDFTPVYKTIKKAVKKDANAYLLLRINVNAPIWWQKEHGEQMTVLSDGKLGMQSIFSEKWKTDVERFLSKLCTYLQAIPYKNNVIALQIAGMHTEEWIALVTATGAYDFSPLAKTAFQKEFPTLQDITARTPLGVEYLRFFNGAYAETISRFCAFTKKACHRQWLVGAFYGYIGQLGSDRGHCAFSRLLDDENVDFFASPFSYVDSRHTPKDWFYHGAMDSVRLREKLWFIEADVRTHLTRPLNETNPELMEGARTVDYFNRPVFAGPQRKETALWTLLRSFSKVLISGDAFWWFDMWGGWYDDPTMMEFMKKSFALYENARNTPMKKESEIAVFLDENASYYIPDEQFRAVSFQQLALLGEVGAPYDIYALGDDGKIPEKQYKVKLYICPNGKESVLTIGDEKRTTGATFTPTEISSALKKAGGHVFSEGNIVYANTGFVSVTATKKGTLKLALPKPAILRSFTTGQEYKGQEFAFDFEENQTELFLIQN